MKITKNSEEKFYLGKGLIYRWELYDDDDDDIPEEWTD